jgi:type II secretory pathway pseudopilin PulG
MKLRNRQQGMTMWGMLFVISVIAFVVFMVIKLFPPYKDDFKVKAALDSVMRQSDAASLTREDIVGSLSRRFDIDDISHVALDKDLQIATRGKMKVVAINYEVEVPIVSNVYVLLKFEHEKQVATGE